MLIRHNLQLFGSVSAALRLAAVMAAGRVGGACMGLLFEAKTKSNRKGESPVPRRIVRFCLGVYNILFKFCHFDIIRVGPHLVPCCESL